MSAETLQAVEDAIADHIRDERPGMLLTDWQAIVCGIPAEAVDASHRAYKRIAPPDMANHVARGLNEMMLDATADHFEPVDDD
ncbi:hypothetical protein [Pseudoclavibacter helvolus]|uniref:hypothetical protein n=1 Tax=Pseudoclavibacter helvolus TaxID=255205 RepID=UPI003C714E6A